MKELELDRSSALVIVAHPDDETIWMGGTMLTFPGIKWYILSLCRSDDPDRAPKFYRVAKEYGAKALIMNLEDEGIMNIQESEKEIEIRLKEALRYFRRKKYDYLFTHGANGEYGHPRHKGVHRVVKDFYNSGKIKAKEAYAFSYHQQALNSFATPKSTGAVVKTGLEKDVHQEKKDIIHKIYGFRKQIFEYRSCAKVEMFRDLS